MLVKIWNWKGKFGIAVMYIFLFLFLYERLRSFQHSFKSWWKQVQSPILFFFFCIVPGYTSLPIYPPHVLPISIPTLWMVRAFSASLQAANVHEGTALFAWKAYASPIITIGVAEKIQRYRQLKAPFVVTWKIYGTIDANGFSGAQKIKISKQNHKSEIGSCTRVLPFSQPKLRGKLGLDDLAKKILNL